MAEVLGQRERSGVPTGGDALEIDLNLERTIRNIGSPDYTKCHRFSRKLYFIATKIGGYFSP